MSSKQKETTEEKVFRVIMRVMAGFTALFILFIVSTMATTVNDITPDSVTALRGAAMLGFMGWLFVLGNTLRPRK